MEMLAIIVIGIVVVLIAFDRAVILPLARAKNIENNPSIKRKRGMADTLGVIAVIVVIILVILAAQ